MMQTSDALRREKADVYLSTSLRAQRVARMRADALARMTGRLFDN